MLTNVAYLVVLPVDEIARVPENRVAERAAMVLFGNAGSTLVIVAILVSTFGCLNGLILGGAGSATPWPARGFSSEAAPTCTRQDTLAALAYQGVWSMILALTGSYSELLTYSTFASVLFGGLTVAAVYRLRFKRPDLPRPYRCWGYPVTPAVLPGDLPGVSGLCHPRRSLGHGDRSFAGPQRGSILLDVESEALLPCRP